MAFDFDPFSHLDMNFDQIVDASDLQMYEFVNGNGFDLLDLNHDTLLDQYQLDLNLDNQLDSYQADLNGNSILDKYEFQNMGMTDFNYDLNHDGTVDELDKALATTLFPK
ncbi:hypothetical protein V7112_05275 [Bacillus sp. JJ1566]|uniref:hypothetical protein n=1 Tax=Bacillus sp. JJ1566 TaxID=3122961 RepID=UPI002FFFF6E7